MFPVGNGPGADGGDERRYTADVTLGPSIATARREAGLTQAQLAALLGVSEQAVKQWEAGRNAVNSRNLVRLAHVLPGLRLAEVEL